MTLRTLVLPLVALVALAAIAIGSIERGVDRAQVAKSLPVFEALALDRATSGFDSAALAGQVSVINFFASWCLPCRAEHPLLMRLAESDGATLYGIAYRDKPADARAWLDSLGNPFAAIGADPDAMIGQAFGVIGVPQTFVVGKDGQIRYRHLGPITAGDLDKLFLPLIQRLNR